MDFEERPQFECVKPRVVTIYSDKGGDGKTTVAVETACCLGSAGYRVLVIDFDTNNSSSFFFVKDLGCEEVRHEKNTARAFFDEENDLSKFAVKSIRAGVDIIPCSRSMASLRSMSERRALRMLPSLRGKYDIVIFDCKPNYDNFALNAFHAADIILTPVQKSLDSYNAVKFLKRQLAVETDKSGCWFVMINGYNRRYKDAEGGEQKEYIEVFREEFRLTPEECWFPWSCVVRQIKDRRGFLSCGERKDIKNCFCAPVLYEAVVNLSSTLIVEDGFEPAEVF